MKKPKLFDIVQIDWLDSMHVGGWQRWEDVDWKRNANTLNHKTTGYIAHQTDDAVSVVQSFSDMWENGHPTNVDAVMTIPRTAITRITVLARKNDRKGFSGD